MYAYLRVVAGPDQGKIYNLVEGTTLSIGRGEHSDTRLKDTTACRLWPRNGPGLAPIWNRPHPADAGADRLTPNIA